MTLDLTNTAARFDWKPLVLVLTIASFAGTVYYLQHPASPEAIQAAMEDSPGCFASLQNDVSPDRAITNMTLMGVSHFCTEVSEDELNAIRGGTDECMATRVNELAEMGPVYRVDLERLTGDCKDAAQLKAFLTQDHPELNQ